MLGCSCRGWQGGFLTDHLERDLVHTSLESVKLRGECKQVKMSSPGLARGHEQSVSRSMHFLFWDTVNILKTRGPPCSLGRVIVVRSSPFYCVCVCFFVISAKNALRFYQEGCRLPWANRVDRKSRRRKIGNTTLFAVEQISCVCAHTRHGNETSKSILIFSDFFRWDLLIRPRSVLVARRRE